mgnify:CR=1 FL=1
MSGKAVVTFAPSHPVHAPDVSKAVEDAGFKAHALKATASHAARAEVRLAVEGMTCASCSGSVQKALDSINGVISAK